MKRRDFIKNSAAGIVAAAGSVSAREALAAENKGNAAELPKRAFKDYEGGIAVVGFGGIIVTNEEIDSAKRMVAEAWERGCNYYDVAPAYGNAESRLGPALAPYRKDAFLACKTNMRTREEAEKQWNESLELLQTDYFDLYQLHAITDVDKDVIASFDNGVMDFIEEKKKDGQIRYVGFSAHSTAAAKAAVERYDFDSVLFPVNYASLKKGGFGDEIMQLAQEKDMERLALKAMAKQKWQQGADRDAFPKCWYEPITDDETISAALRWTLSQPVASAIPPGVWDMFVQAVDVASNRVDINEEETQLLASKVDDWEPLFPVV